MIGFIDNGSGNLFSIKRGIIAAGKKYKSVNKDDNFTDFSHIILPGVGAFKPAIDYLRNNKIDLKLKHYINEGGKLVGICLGMQLMMTKSSEFGIFEGLNFFSGTVLPIPIDKGLKIPNLGWNELLIEKKE